MKILPFARMIKAILLIVEPGSIWAGIAEARRGLAFILTIYLLPFIAITSLVEGWGLAHWGKWQSKFQFTKHFSLPAVIGYEVIQALLLLAMVLVAAYIVLKIAQTFHGRTSYVQAFRTMAYGFSPIFLLHLLDAAPQMNPLITWGIGIGLTIWVLYQGIPRVMEPDPTHAFGLYLATIMVAVLTSAVVRLLTGMYLLGYMDFQHSYLMQKLSSLFH